MKKKNFVPQIKNAGIIQSPEREGKEIIGIGADVLGQRQYKDISPETKRWWKNASAEEKPLVALGIAADVFRSHILMHKNMDSRKVQTPQELMFHLWDETGRQAKGQEWDLLVYDRKQFPDNEETEITFDIHDGFAVGEYEGKEYVMTYPTMLEVSLTKSMEQEISNYVGQAVTDTGICPADVALTYGEITMVNELNERNRTVAEDETEKRISDINIYSGRFGGMFIRCKIDGEQQSAKKMNAFDTKSFNDETDRKALASRYYKDELQEDRSQERSSSMKR